MTKEEFIKKAKDLGYSDEEIQEIIAFNENLPLPYELLPLTEKPVY